MRRFLLIAVLLATPGCLSAYVETEERGRALLKEARGYERAGQYPKANAAFAQAELVLLDAAKILVDDERPTVLVSFINHNLSIVAAGQGRSSRPDNDPAGSWSAAIEHFKRSGDYATRSTFLKLNVLSLCERAECMRPDNNPEGSWAEASKLYETADKLTKNYDDDKGRGVTLRMRAICLMEGKTDAKWSKAARRLLEKARKLGDEDAEDLLAESEDGRYCVGCGRSMAEGTKFCASCGQDQAEPVKKKKPELPKKNPNERRGGQLSPGRG
jgi:hypothetical protein